MKQELITKKEMLKKEVSEFDIKDIAPIAIVLVVTGIILAFGLQIQGDVQSDMTVDTAEYNASRDAITGVAKLPAKLPLIVTIIVAVIVVGLLTRYLMTK